MPEGSWSRRAFIVAAAAGGAGAVAALDGPSKQGTVFGGTMALSQAYNVSEDLWIGPDSAKSNVDANDGRVYMASDTQVEYYGDGGSWVKLGVGSSSEPVPSVTTDDVDINGNDFVATGEYFPLFAVSIRGSFSTSGTSYSTQTAFIQRGFIDLSNFPISDIGVSLSGGITNDTQGQTTFVRVQIGQFNGQDDKIAEISVTDTGNVTSSSGEPESITSSPSDGVVEVDIQMKVDGGTGTFNNPIVYFWGEL